MALVFAAQKLRHYFLTHEVHLMVKDNPVKFLLTQPALSGRAAKWLVKLMEFDIKCVVQNAVKGQDLADLLASHPRWPEEERNVMHVMNTNQRPVYWTLYFDGAAVGVRGGAGASCGAGVVLMDPDGQLNLHSYSLNYFCTNNTAEYDALILGRELAIRMEIHRLL